MYETGFNDTNLIGKCHSCIHYIPRIKPLYGFKEVKVCWGICNHAKVNKRYKQRTESCKKYKKIKKESENMIDIKEVIEDK